MDGVDEPPGESNKSHLLLPASDLVAGGQDMHVFIDDAAVSAEYLPATQSIQALLEVAARSTEYFPMLQPVQV